MFKTNAVPRQPGGVAGLLELESVPPVTTKRWFPQHKAQIVMAIEARLLSIEEACRLYDLSLDEIIAWQRGFAERGLSGLCASDSPRVRRRKQRQEREAHDAMIRRLAGSGHA